MSRRTLDIMESERSTIAANEAGARIAARYNRMAASVDRMAERLDALSDELYEIFGDCANANEAEDATECLKALANALRRGER